MQLKDDKPRRMYGITPPPYEIPPERLPQPKLPKSKRPFLITLYGGYRLFWAGVSLILALVPWGDPESGLTSYAVAHPALVVDLLPGFLRMLLPSFTLGRWSQGAFLLGLPILFSMAAVLYALQGWMLLALSKWWRWFTMLAAALTVAEIAIGLSARLVGTASRPLSSAALTAVLIIGTWNLLVYCYLGYYPGVKEAFEGQDY
jgi:hypothetical protein